MEVHNTPCLVCNSLCSSPYCSTECEDFDSASGYHLENIPKATPGTSKKIFEEVRELMDAEQQEAKLMILCELADIVGAVELYLQKNCPGTTVEDLHKMARLTARAFRKGKR